ncbi:MAG: 50S ribosomal protein L25/general stress protein Ctc [Candidatus Rokuibacteriota bacterium]
MRHAGFVPGIVYGGTKEPLAIQLDHNALYHALRKEAFHSSVLNLKVGDINEMALLRDVQMHAYKPLILHVDFQRIDADHKIHVKVPLHFVNADIAPGVKLAHGLVNHVMTEVDVACLPGNLPEFIEVDLANLESGHSIHVADLKLPAGVEPVAHLKAENPAVVGITPPKGAAAEEAAPAAAPEAPAA